MKITVVTPYALDRPGGVQQHAAELVEGLSVRGHEALLVGPGTTGPEGSVLLGPAVRVRANRSAAPIALDPRVRRRLEAAATGADVVHIHEPFMPLVGWGALALDVPRVATFHADPPRWVVAGMSVLARVLRVRLQDPAVAVTAVSPVASRPLERIGVEPEIIPNAIHVSEYGGKARASGRVAFLGRDERRKGLDVLLEAWPSVREAVPSAELVVLGVERDQIPGVRFAGRVASSVKRIELASAEVFCAPNLGGESFGITVLEGMASGCAVVASDLAGFRYVTGDSAVLVPAGDVEALGMALTEVLTDPPRQADLVTRSSQRSRRFDWAEVIPQYERVYESLTAS